MHRSFDPETMRKAFEPYPDIFPEDCDFQAWLNNLNNVMLVEDDSVGLACFEYPGVYTGHYLFQVGGRDALKLARKMMHWMINNEGAKAFTGITPAGKKAARWFNRNLGFTSYGIIDTVRGPHEMFCITADEFLRKENQ
jgi:hypothetical protein